MPPHLEPLTPLLFNRTLSEALKCEVLLKCEHLAPTGSFKYRGAASKLTRLGVSARAGVVTASTGNHGKAVAAAARELGVGVTVFAPADADGAKLDAIRGLDARIMVVDGTALDAEAAARSYGTSAGLPYISPYNDLDVIAGSANLGREILAQAPQADAIFLSVGGGGLLSGVGSAVKSIKPGVRIIGCWPRNADALYQLLVEGVARATPETATLSDATVGGAEKDSITIPICKTVLDVAVRVSETQIRDAMRAIFVHSSQRVEGAAGVAFAGLAALADQFSGRSVTVVLCGGNIAPDVFREVLGDVAAPDTRAGPAPLNSP